jgi:UDPglucose 6-dehydrogenase
MRAGVIGYGVVGTATVEVLRRLGHEVFVTDTSPARTEAALSEGHQHLDWSTEINVLFICVPEKNVSDALAAAPDSDITVIRSSVPPGTTDSLSRRFGRSLVHMPEFLKEATALWDSLNPSFILIGCHNHDDGQRLGQLFAPLLVPVRIVTPTISETVKLVLNSYLHTLISFWNEVHLISERIGVPSHIVGKLCSQDPRVPAYGASMHGKPAGGRCLPKDIAQLINLAKSKGYVPELLEAVQKTNDRLTANGHNGHGDVAETELLALVENASKG